MAYSKDFNSMETTKKGIEGEKNLEKFLTTQKGFMIMPHNDGLHEIDYYVYYNDKMVAVADSKNKEYMHYRPAQGFNLSHLSDYVRLASRFKVPALVICLDSALKTVYALDLIYAFRCFRDRMFIRLGKDIHTDERILQVETPLNLYGKIAELGEIYPDFHEADFTPYACKNRPEHISKLFTQSSTTAILTAIKHGVTYPNELYGIQSNICIAKREVEPMDIVNALPIRFKTKIEQHEIYRQLEDFKRRCN